MDWRIVLLESDTSNYVFDVINGSAGQDREQTRELTK